jgi:hypothetical protein
VWLPLAALLVACGPPSGPSASDSLTTPQPPTASVEPDLPPGGRLDQDALSGFACGPDDAGVWTATGTLTNTGTDDADYVVTVVVAGPDSLTVKAKRQVVGLRSGGSEPLEIDTLPLPSDGELSCQAEVVRRS